MIIDRDPGDETDAPRALPMRDARALCGTLADASTERSTPPSDLERITALLAGTGIVSQRALERLLLAQRQHHQGQRTERPKLSAA